MLGSALGQRLEPGQCDGQALVDLRADPTAQQRCQKAGKADAVHDLRGHVTLLQPVFEHHAKERNSGLCGLSSGRRPSADAQA